MTERALEDVEIELNQKKAILKRARESVISCASRAKEAKEEKAIEIVETRHTKDEKLREIEKQRLIEEYSYEKGRQHAYEHMQNLF